MGQHAVLLRAELKSDGSIEGHVQGHRFFDHSWEEFVGERAEDVAIPDPLDRVSLLPGKNELDLDPVLEATYSGKALIVEIFGTWCPNCGDHTRVLAELHRKYHVQGLEILGFAFEYASTRKSKEQRLREFKKKHNVEWEVVIADPPFQDGFAGLSTIEGVPVTIFVNRDGTVRAIYTGFSGPATGGAHENVKAQFERLTGEILSSTGKGKTANTL